MRSLFVASAGGHLEELRLLAEQLPSEDREITWVTWDSPQTRSLFEAERLVLIKKAPPRDLGAMVACARVANRLYRREHFDEVVSTGALPAVPFIAIGRSRHVACRYIESATRISAPSLSGRIIERIPGVERYRQYPDWTGAASNRRWRYGGSVFDVFAPGPTVVRRPRRAVVALGSSGYGFRRLIVAAMRALPVDCEVVWQTGSTDVRGLPLAAADMLAADDFERAVANADVVISHAGVGSALVALRHGHCPILVPRSRHFHEHVDDHQHALAGILAERGLALSCDASELDADVVSEAASRSIVRTGTGFFTGRVALSDDHGRGAGRVETAATAAGFTRSKRLRGIA